MSRAVEAKLTMYPGAIEAFDRAIAADPGFALAHAAKAHVLLERGDAAAARASIAAANSLAAGLSAREAGHVAFFDLLVAGDAEAALSALLAHLDAWPRDAVALATTAFTNGLIGSSGRAGQKRMLLESAGQAGPELWRRLVVHGASRHGAVGKRTARRRPPEDRPLPRPEPEEPLGGARPRASVLRGGRSGRGPRLSGVLAHRPIRAMARCTAI